MGIKVRHIYIESAIAYKIAMSNIEVLSDSKESLTPYLYPLWLSFVCFDYFEESLPVMIDGITLFTLNI